MTSLLDLTLYPLAYKHGQVRKQPGLYAAQATFRAARGRSGDTLVIHLALDGTAPLGEKEHQKLVKTLADTYFKTSGSSTSAMRTVAEWLNGFLVDRNQRGANRSLQSAGLLTQAVFRGEHLYLAQCGPTHAFLIKSPGLTHYHLSNLAWRGLGFNRVPEIRYHQERISPGDLLLISADPPPAWTAERLAQLRGLSLEEMGSILMLQAGTELDAALIRLEPGSGKLNVVEPVSIEALRLAPEDIHQSQPDEEIDQEKEHLPSETSSLDEQAASARTEHYFQGLLPFKEVPLDQSIEAPSEQPVSEDASSEMETPPAQIPDDLAAELEQTGAVNGHSLGVDEGKGGTLIRQEADRFQAESDGSDQDIPLGGQASLHRSGGRLSKLPRWTWRTIVVILLVGIVGLIYLISQGLPDLSTGALGLIQASDTPQPTPTQTFLPSSTPQPTSTETSLPPTETSTPLPPTVTLTPSMTPKYRLGSTQISPVDKMVMVYVPAGTFVMGANEQASNALRDERPQHTVNLDGFWIDQTEVTNGQYAQCVAARECRIPYSLTSFTRNPYFNVPEYADFPVIFVSWNDAQNYCQWAGRRLPTEAEWEKAARGQDERIYPWGDDLDCDLANYQDCLGDTAAADQYPDGASPYGVLNMAGNVWEWVADWYYFAYYDIAPLDNPTGPQSGLYRVIRGGSWNDDPIYLRTSSRYWYYPDNARFSVGFRCAISESP